MNFTCTYEQLKQMAVEFLKALPTMNADEAESGLKCFNLHYIDCQYADKAEEVMAVALVNYVNKKHIQHVLPLTC